MNQGPRPHGKDINGPVDMRGGTEPRTHERMHTIPAPSNSSNSPLHSDVKMPFRKFASVELGNQSSGMGAQDGPRRMSLMSGIDSGIPESAISPSNIIPLFEKQRGLRFHAWKLFATMLVHLLTVPAFLVRFGILVYRGQLSNKENRKLLVSFAMSALAYTM